TPRGAGEDAAEAGVAGGRPTPAAAGTVGDVGSGSGSSASSKVTSLIARLAPATKGCSRIRTRALRASGGACTATVVTMVPAPTTIAAPSVETVAESSVAIWAPLASAEAYQASRTQPARTPLS